MFGGIGAIRKAFIKQRIPYEVVDYVEIDKNCVKSYNALYDEHYKPKSVINYHAPNKKIDILMHGSPCQDFSLIGLRRGGEKGSGTRSSLLFETIRIISEMKSKPKIVIWENVTGVLNKKMIKTFFNYLSEMEKLGYVNKYEILNAMDFGIPQNRNRVFVVSILHSNNFSFDNLIKRKTRHIDEFLEKDVKSIYEVTQKSIITKIQKYIKWKNNPNYPIDRFSTTVRIIKDHVHTISTEQQRIPNSGFISLGNGRFRYLTERECFRLMGFLDEDFDKLEELYFNKKGEKSSILYKQAGNSIVVNVLEGILQNICIPIFLSKK